ncbi:hypothetical protein T210_0107270 [Burkholderia pseudomallei MSHR6137]|nr:hypothetical protein T210_0107270 [Burkholderia pseudomallei MSHR6137]
MKRQFTESVVSAIRVRSLRRNGVRSKLLCCTIRGDAKVMPDFLRDFRGACTDIAYTEIGIPQRFKRV